MSTHELLVREVAVKVAAGAVEELGDRTLPVVRVGAVRADI
jgi:hypothetical protein